MRNPTAGSIGIYTSVAPYKEDALDINTEYNLIR